MKWEADSVFLEWMTQLTLKYESFQDENNHLTLFFVSTEHFFFA